MKTEWIALIGMGLTIGGFIWHAGRMAERQTAMREQFEKFEKEVKDELRSMRELLADSGGRRRIYRSSGRANDAGRGAARSDPEPVSGAELREMFRRKFD